VDASSSSSSSKTGAQESVKRIQFAQWLTAHEADQSAVSVQPSKVCRIMYWLHTLQP
jgi:predicted acetyltransferase